jgi:nucleotide-binding universal stress UspA family protein
MKILLAVEESKYSEAAVRALLARAVPQGTEVRVLNVVEPPSLLVVREMGGYEPSLEAAWQAHLNEVQSFVAKKAQELRAHGLNVTTVVEQGDPKSVILEVASHWHADLIVMGSHGKRGLDRFLMGSVSEAVVRHAPCSVEIVRIPGKP